MVTKWYKVPDFEGYFISKCGKVKSCVRSKSRLLKFDISNKGYYRVTLSKNGKTKRFSVHRLMAKVFLKDYSENLQVNHIDGVRTNNNIDNLEMVTQSENNKHALRIGLQKPTYGTINGMSKLTEKEVLEIRNLAKEGMKQKEIAKVYGIVRQTVNDIVNRKAWKHI